MSTRARFGASLAFFLVLGVLSAPQAAAVRKPDLKTVSAKIKPNIIFRNTQEQQQLDWTIKVTNAGHKAAPPSTGGTKPEEVVFGVPKVAVGGVEKVGALQISTFPASDYRYGSNTFQVCADAPGQIPEERENNNCGADAVLYVVPFRFSGSVSGTQPFLGLPGVTEQWAGSATFEHFKTEPVDGLKGLFLLHYKLVSGSLSYTVSGSNGGSSYSGSGSATLAPSTQCRITMQISTRDPSEPMPYGSGSCLTGSFSFVVTVTTGGISFPGASGPSSPIWLSANGDEAEQGFASLSHTSSPAMGIQYTWNLAAQDGA